MFRRVTRDAPGQTLVEVALVLPVFLLALVAILELGWYAGVASATTTASREAARYGSTVGIAADGQPHYVDCNGIRAAARSNTNPLVTLADSDIDVSYDDGTGAAVGESCVSSASRPGADELQTFDRVVVTVRVRYEPITPLLRGIIGTPTLTSLEARSIAKP